LTESMMVSKEPLKIGNAQGFWGDSPGAPAQLVSQAADLDYLTLDYLAEVSMSILAKQRDRDPAAGYARDFVEVVRSLAPMWREGRKLRLVTNAGGLNPHGCAIACDETLRSAGCVGMKIGVVIGDDVLPILRENPDDFPHLETGAPSSNVLPSLVTANAYLGAEPLVEAIRRGADIVVTGRVADPSLTVAPCIAHYTWPSDDFNRIAGATVAGHLIECGTQVSGGISTNWLEMNNDNIGYPIVEVAADGSCVVTKPLGTGGRVSERTVKEQLVYEIGDPAAYLSPDATVSFLSLRVSDEGNDRVRVWGATGSAPPARYKVSATYRAGFRASGMLTIFGRDAVAKARRCGELVLNRLKAVGCNPKQYGVECLGAGDVAPGVFADAGRNLIETALRISVSDSRREVVERFTREMAPLVTNGPQGTTGYAEGRPAVHEVFGYWPTLIDRKLVATRIEMVEV
jgi:hypothetical protein